MPMSFSSIGQQSGNLPVMALLYKQGSTFKALNKNGLSQYSGTEFGAVFNDAVSNLLTSGRTRPECIKLRGTDLTGITTKLSVPALTLIDAYGAYIKQDGDSLDDNLLENENYGAGDDHSIYIHGGIWDGHSAGAGRSAGHVIALSSNSEPSASARQAVGFPKMELKDLTAIYGYDDSINFNNSGASTIKVNLLNVATRYSNDYGVNINSCSDVVFNHGHHVGGNTRGLRISGGELFLFSNLYIPEGMYAYWCNNLNMHNCFFDATQDGAELKRVTGGSFIGNTFRLLSSADNTHDGIEMTDASGVGTKYCSFHGNIFYKDSSDDWKYGIEESANSDYNSFVGNVNEGSCQTGTIRVQGGNSNETGTV